MTKQKFLARLREGLRGLPEADIEERLTFYGEMLDDRMEIDRSTGDVELDGCDAGEISIKTSTGDVTASLLTQKVFLAESATGSVDVPRTTRGGTCEVTSGTGDIEITIK